MQASDRNVYILGAGFSSAAGVPLVDDFIERAKVIYYRNGSSLSPEARVRFASALEFRRRMVDMREHVRMKLGNVEEIFGLADMSRQLGDIDDRVWADCTYLIAKTVELAATQSLQYPNVPYTILLKGWYGDR